MGKPQIPLEVDDVTGWWKADALPMILVPQHFFVNNHKAVEEAMGVEAYSGILDKAGYKSAYYWCEKEAEHYGMGPVEVFHHYLKRLSQRGWGMFSIEEIDPEKGTARIRLDHSAFVNQYGRNAGRDVDYMFNGWWVGAMEYVGKKLGKDYKVQSREVQCAAEGQHDHCVFEVKPV